MFGFYLEKIYRGIHYEDKHWPLWQLHKNARYLLKSFFLCRHPEKSQDKIHFYEAHEYIYSSFSKKNTANTGSEFSLAFVGDVMWTKNRADNYLSPEVEAYVSATDGVLVNLETPVSDLHKIPKNTFDHFNADKSILTPWEKLQNEKIISVCNNHVLDCGLSGLKRTINAIKEKNMEVVGGVSKKSQIVIKIINGIRVGVIGATYGINNVRGKEPDIGVPVVNFTDKKKMIDWASVKEQVSICQESQCHLIIYMPHWGYEYEFWPIEYQRQNAYKIIEIGVDIIVGNSPHVVQPMEIISINKFDENCPIQINRDGLAKHAVIFYSLGNALSCMPGKHCKEGIIPKLTYRYDLHKKNLALIKLDILPIKTETIFGKQLICVIDNLRRSFGLKVFKKILSLKES